ncbi:MAG: matrixin family metalloprotease [Terriglobales bacterium]
MKNLRAAALFAVLSLFISAVPFATPTCAYNRRLPPSGFPVGGYSRWAGGGSGLSKVTGVHLSDGEDRPANGPAGVYPPGEEVVHGQLVRWEPRKMPLYVFISNGVKLPDVPFSQLQQTRVELVAAMLRSDSPDPFYGLDRAAGWTPETNDLVALGIEQWREFQNEGLFKYKFVDDPRKAHILVFFTDSFKDANSPGGIMVGGNTCAQIFTLSQSQSMNLQKPVVIELSTMVNHSPERMQGAAAHEFGHALGIKAHSPYRQDIMYVDRVVNELSPSDKMTIRWLYHQPLKWVM